MKGISASRPRKCMPKTFTCVPACIQTLIGVCANPLPGLERPVAFIVHCRLYWAYAIKHFLQIRPHRFERVYLAGRGLYLHKLCLDFIAARRMSGSKLCAARRKAYLATGRPPNTSIGHTFLQMCGGTIERTAKRCGRVKSTCSGANKGNSL